MIPAFAKACKSAVKIPDRVLLLLVLLLLLVAECWVQSAEY